ncbi:MAG: beta-galactosidase [Bacteroidales bacterium]|jgi:hypothetical protein|nr:beta-galactosidase [Bacteroidales bacterium]
MRKNFFTIVFIAFIVNGFSQWQPQGDRIKTRWAATINPDHVLQEYPRPLMERADWQNLNGLWDYAILPAGKPEPAVFQGKILVPFAAESSLSGVQQPVGADKELWYNRTFSIPKNWKGKDVMLHFGAVDWKTAVYLNGIKIGEHTGGYTPFCFDITPFLNSGENKLTVRVYDNTDKGYQPHGKQVSRPEGIWYTAVTGIWQTVWLEPVSHKHVTSLRATPDIDRELLSVKIGVAHAEPADYAEIQVFDGAKLVASQKTILETEADLHIENPKLWSPDSPFLYDLKIQVFSGGKVVDVVKSYAAMRKISSLRDKDGIMRMQLNNKNLFHYGTLDQGWFPDGLYTAPSDEALRYDIEKTKELGFNMIRKHVKVEPARWYYHCDKLGILVWQDMPSGDRTASWQSRDYYTGTELIRTTASENNYRKEWKEIIDYLYSHPSVVVWVPFNEAWGQFKTEDISEWTRHYDPSRLLNPASGGNFFHTGDILDLHNYPNPDMYLFDMKRVNVLGEYGGIGLAVEGHLWQPDRNWGYIQFKNPKEVTDEYVKYAQDLKKWVVRGFAGAVYTQTTDVEGEVNGLMTYDREKMKVEIDRVRKANREVIQLGSE